MIIKSLLLGLFLFSNFGKSFAQQPQSVAALKSLDWLIGTWQREGRRGPVFEQWTKVSNHTFEGLSFRISEGDTIYLEFLRLEQFGNEIFYTPKVAHNKYPIPFKLVNVGEKVFKFEHPEHDFPQRIIYTLETDGSLHVRTEGTDKGKLSGFDFHFKKVK